MCKGEVEKVAKIYEESFPEHVFIKQLSDPNFFLKELDENKNTLWIVAECKQTHEIVGCAALAEVPLNYSAEIERVVVHKPFRNNGISKLMCESLVNAAKELGDNYVFAWVRGTQPAMQKTFLDLGFEVGAIVPPFFVVLYKDKFTPRKSVDEVAVPLREPFVYMFKILSNDVAMYSNLVPELELLNRLFEEAREKVKRMRYNSAFNT
jgi:N-acetylglutamate synthase-like GNAT family acetyltransferase